MQNKNSDRTIEKYFIESIYTLTGWQPFLDGLKRYYASHDKFRTLIDDGYEPQLSLENYYVNLALVTGDSHRNIVNQLKASSSVDTRHAETVPLQENSLKREERYQSLLLSGQTLNVNDLFDNLESRSNEAGWISITGRAGAGKTTLLQYITYRWGGAREALWHNRFDFVFKVQLNLLKSDEYKSLSPLKILGQVIDKGFDRTQGYDNVLSAENIHACLAEKGYRNRTLLLLDGFDEIQKLYNEENKHIKNFIDWVTNVEQFPNGVMTTRPDTIPTSWQLKQPARFKKQYENVGFTSDDVYQYVEKYFGEELASKESLITALNTNPEMLSLAQIPINSHILCLTWKDREEKLLASNNELGHFTMTQLYYELLIWLMKRYCNKFKALKERNPEQLFSICEKEISTISKIAYEAFIASSNETQFIEGDFIKRHVKDSVFLEELIKEFGVLRAFNERDDGYAEYYYFVHLTYQEFFAALYIAKHLSINPFPDRQREEERRKKIQSLVHRIANNRDNPQYEVVWIFLAGLVSTHQYRKGADYFWDAIIDFPEENVQALTFHPHTKILQAKQRILREAFLTLNSDSTPVVPRRLSDLRRHLQYLHEWQGVQKIEALERTWDAEYSNTLAEKKYRRWQKQYQSDSLALGLVSRNSKFSLIEFLQTVPRFSEVLRETIDNLKTSGLSIPGIVTLRVLNRFGTNDPNILQNIQSLLSSPNIYVRFIAAKTVYQCTKASEALEILKNSLSNEDFNLRGAAVESFGQLEIEASEVSDLLVNLLTDKNYWVQLKTVEVIGQLRIADTQVIQKLKTLLTDSNGALLCKVAVALYQCTEDPTALQILKNLLNDKTVYFDAANALNQLGINNAGVISMLKNRLKSKIFSRRVYAAESIGKLGIQDPEIIQILMSFLKNTHHPGMMWPENDADLGRYHEENRLRQEEDMVKHAAATALSRLGITNRWIQDELTRNHYPILHDIYKDSEISKAIAQGRLNIDDTTKIYDLIRQSEHKERNKRYSAIEALILSNVQTIKHYIKRFSVENDVDVLFQLCIALLRTSAVAYVPLLSDLESSIAQQLTYLFIASSYFQGIELFQKEEQWFLNGNLIILSEQTIGTLLSEKVRFIQTTSGYSERLNAMSDSINIPHKTNVFSADFLSSGLPEDELSESDRWKLSIEDALRILFCRVDGLNGEVENIKRELSNIKQKVQSDWEGAQGTLTSDNDPYIKKFKQQLVQMYIVATVVSSGQVQRNLTGTTGNVVTVLEVIAGLVPWGGGAVQMLSRLIQAIGARVQQNSMEHITHLGSSPEDVARLAVTLSQRLLHCLDIEHAVHDGRMTKIFSSLSNIVQCYEQNGFYGALFGALAESDLVDKIANKIVTQMTLTEMEERAVNDAHLLLLAVMKEGVPRNPNQEIDTDRLFLYSAPFLTVIDSMFASMVIKYCQLNNYKQSSNKIEHKAKFCESVAKQCFKKATDAARRLDDTSKRDEFVDNLATEFNRKGVLNPIQRFSFLRMIGYSSATRLSVNRELLNNNTIIEEVCESVLSGP